MQLFEQKMSRETAAGFTTTTVRQKLNHHSGLTASQQGRNILEKDDMGIQLRNSDKSSIVTSAKDLLGQKTRQS